MGVKKGEGQGTCIEDPWVLTAEWGLTVRERREQQGKMWDNCNWITIKKEKHKILQYKLKITGLSNKEMIKNLKAQIYIR